MSFRHLLLQREQRITVSTDFLSRLVRRSPSQQANPHEELIAQKRKNDRSNTIVARLTKVYANVVRSCSNDNSVSYLDTDASAPDWALMSTECYLKEGILYVRVKALSTVPTFVGLDTRNYSLQEGDILFIPYENAQVLSARGLAVPAEPSIGRAVDPNAEELYHEEDVSVGSDAS